MADPNVDSSCADRANDIQKYIDAIDKGLSQGKGRWGDLPSGLRDELRSKLHSTKIICLSKEADDCKVGIEGRVSNSEISLCPGANEGTLLHELVHANGGDELDSEALENHLYRFKKSEPEGDDFEKFLFKDKPCAFMEKKGKLLLVSKNVIWNPRTGELWIREGTRAQPKKGKKLKPTFIPSIIDRQKLEKNPPSDCGSEQAQKCGAQCKDFKTYGLCDRKVFHPPCYQHRSAV